MDDIVKQALLKWPNVPDCYGWLGLDARGNWYMRDDATQALGAFANGDARTKGSLLKHDKLIDFIGRNYACDGIGQWYFQNGPQRVFVELESTPWVWRIGEDATVAAHTGALTGFVHCLMDENGWLYLETEMGFGLVHTQDVAQAALAIEAGQWQVHTIALSQLEARYGFVKSPQKHRGLLGARC